VKLRFSASLLALGSASLLAHPGEAQACGGCFVQPQDATIVTGHRMVLSLSPDQTVLWDQIKYAGDPAEFAWVLPVRVGATIEVSSDAWFETLDAATTTTVLAPQISCATSGGLGCGAQADALSFPGEANGGGGVTVVHEGTVGPYETVTLQTDKPGALNAWLDSHGFNIDAATQPIVDAYVKEGFQFIALRLQPGKGVAQMKPVRVLTQGASPTLPLRMVAAGTGPQVSVILFTLSEARMAPKNFPEAVVPRALISWDFATQSSTYAELRQAALSLQGGKAWLTPYAQPRTLLSGFDSAGLGFRVQYSNPDGSTVDTIAGAYIARGLASGETLSGSCGAALAQAAESSSLVKNPCPFGAKPDDPSCGSVPFGEIDSRTLACGALDDLAVALRGLHPRDVWLTRLEAQLPRAALGTDLELQPAAAQLPVDNWIRAQRTEGEACPSGVVPTLGGGKGGPRRLDLAALGLLALGLAAVARRAARTPAQPARAR
jgi:hypothetical protein